MKIHDNRLHGWNTLELRTEHQFMNFTGDIYGVGWRLVLKGGSLYLKECAKESIAHWIIVLRSFILEEVSNLCFVFYS